MSVTSQVRVLVIDDESSIRESLTEYLEDFDFNVTSAESAEEALGVLENTPHDIAIVDMRLPGMDGNAMILNAHSKCPDMRFLIHTGSVDYQLTQKLKNIGIRQEHIFLKPIPDLSIFVDAIRNFFDL